MIRKLSWQLIAVGLVVAPWSSAWGQATIPAFPGAEGAGKFAAGGRGGAVYIVKNLNNSGTGSLREGISTAFGPRIIVFEVSGTIHLTSDLTINRSDITIAGQTAPAGGITLADRALRVSNVSDVVVQHLRVRPGNTYTGGDSGPPTGYEPDSVSVTSSQRVVLDHISSSWSTDEVLSVTNFSTDVSVQWSMISEALHDSNHSKGEHGYGSLLRGIDISFHHNLYAHNWSRNPRPGWLENNITPGSYDFVNNVIYNPEDKYGYSVAENFGFNLVGNYGIAGPDTNEDYLFDGGGYGNQIYARDNYLDNNLTFLSAVLDGGPSGALTLSGQHTPLMSRVDVPEISNETSAPLALQQVLSYAGASAWRDAVDKRVVKDVFNQTGSVINSQNEVGGWPTLPSNMAALDPDGLPDWWKTAKGLDPDDNTIGLQYDPDGSGYTYLEKYLHELNAAYMPRTQGLSQVVISTAYGAGADAQVSENSDVSSGVGDSPVLNATYAGPAGNLNEYSLLRFDLSQIEQGSIADAQLELTSFRNTVGERLVRIYGLLPDASSEDWIENSVEFDGAPGFVFDGDSGTRGRDGDQWLNLGEFFEANSAEGDTWPLDNLALAAYLNQLSFREGEDKTVTLAVERYNSVAVQTQFASKEATYLDSTAPGSVPAGTYAPRLVLDAVLLPGMGPDGDFDGDNDVDGDDFLWWQIHDGSPEGLALWEANYGTVLEPLGDSSTAIPEPNSAVLLLCLAGLGLLGRRGAGRARRR